MLNEVERENIKKYLHTNATVFTSVPPSVPEHIDIASNNSVERNQRLGDETEIDSLSLGMTCTTVSLTNTTNVTTLSSHSNNATDPTLVEHSMDLRYRNHANI